MRLIFAFVLTILAMPTRAERIGQTNPILGRVSPVIFCVDPYPPPHPDEPDQALWTMQSDRIAVLPRGWGVPAELGVAFGLEVQARGPDRLHDVTVEISHPALADGDTRHDWVASYPANGYGYSFFGFGTPDELALGTWTFTLTKDDHVLYTYVFEVVPADEAREEIRFCDASE